VEIKTPFISKHRAPLKLESFCPNCDSLMNVDIENSEDPRSRFIQICWYCGFRRVLEEK
jgi:hypothetical protein